MKKRPLEVGIFFLIILIMGLFGSLYSFLFAEVAGRTALQLVPAANFKLVEKYVCPAGASLETEKTGASVICRAPDGTFGANLRPQAVSAVIQIYFGHCRRPVSCLGRGRLGHAR